MMQDPLNALQNLASQGNRNAQTMPMGPGGPNPNQMAPGGPVAASNLLQTLNQQRPGQQMQQMQSIRGQMPMGGGNVSGPGQGLNVVGGPGQQMLGQMSGMQMNVMGGMGNQSNQMVGGGGGASAQQLGAGIPGQMNQMGNVNGPSGGVGGPGSVGGGPTGQMQMNAGQMQGGPMNVNPMNVQQMPINQLNQNQMNVSRNCCV